ncbi:unnamed protein product [Sphagnum balticum]
MTIPADNEDIAPIKVGPPKPPAASMSGGMRQRPPVVKKNLVKRPRTVFVHASPSRDDSDEELEDDAEPAKESQLEAHIDQELVEYRLFKASKSDKEVMLQPDTQKKAREDGDVKHDVDLLPWWQVKSDKFPILAHAVHAILCIPASNSMSECTFSSAGNTRSNKRSRTKTAWLRLDAAGCLNIIAAQRGPGDGRTCSITAHLQSRTRQGPSPSLDYASTPRAKLSFGISDRECTQADPKSASANPFADAGKEAH